MKEYDYLNARIRGMSTHLLGRDGYEQILAATEEEALVETLLGSSYAPQLKEALTVRHGIQAVDSALRRNLYDTFSTIRSFAPAGPRRLLNVQLNQWDTANLLTLVRGVVGKASVPEIMEGILPTGEFDEVQLGELASEPDLRSLAASLTTWGYPFAFEVRRAIMESGPSQDLAVLESSVNRAYFEWAFGELRSGDPNTLLALRVLRMQVDLANIKGALDHVRRRELSRETERQELLGGGQLSARQISSIASAESQLGAFERIGDTYFAPAVEKGILAYGGGGSLGVMERFLEIVVIGAACRLFRAEPLGVGVPLGFMWRKYNEFVNLRILLRGKAYRMPPNIIREELLIA